jgi:hypothetical protein
MEPFENSTAWRLEWIPGECLIKIMDWRFTQIWRGISLSRKASEDLYIGHAMKLWFCTNSSKAAVYMLVQSLLKHPQGLCPPKYHNYYI